MTKRNICLMNDSFPPVIDGVANAVTNYARNIQKDYGTATVVTPYYPNADDSDFPFEVIRYPSLDLTKLVGYRAGNPISAETMQTLEEKHFDLIHSHCPVASTVLARLVRDRIRVPLIFTYHTKFDIDIAHAIRAKWLQEAAVRTLVENISACDEVWTVSRGAVGADLDLPEGVPVFLFVGRLMWYKGLRIILDAMKLLKDGGYDFRMVFVGKGTDGDEIKAYAKELSLGDKVFFAAPAYDRDVVRAWYCRADLFLFPSTFDTNGLVVREAAACGLASVLIAGSCAAEDITDGKNGFFIEENAASMAVLLKKLYGKRALLRQVGENAQKEIYISWESSVRRACARYEVVLENFRRGLYPPHDAPSDEFYRHVSEYLAAVNRARSGLLELRGDVQKGCAQLTEKLDDLWDRFL